MLTIRRVGYLLMLLIGVALVTAMVWRKPPPAPFVGLKTADVPRLVGDWSAPSDYEMPDSIKASLAGADIISRKYVNAAGGTEPVDFVLLGGTTRESLHDPRSCLTGAGWLLADQHPERLPQTDVDVQACHAVGLPGTPGYDVLYLYVVNGRRISAIDQIRTEMLWNALLGRQNEPVYMLRFLAPLHTDATVQAAAHAHLLTFAGQMWNDLHPRLERK